MTSIPTLGSKLSLVLCLLLLVPRVGLAAEDAPVSSDSTAPTEAPRPKSSRPPMGRRLLAEAGLGVATGVGLGLATSLAGGGLCAAGIVGTRGDYVPCFDAVAVGALLGAGVGFPLGVFLGGEALGGDGRFYGAMLGMAAGVGASFVVLSMRDGSFTSAHLLIPPLFAVGGSMLGYELSERGEPAPRAPGAPVVASARPRFQPVLAFSSRGALFGLGGSF